MTSTNNPETFNDKQKAAADVDGNGDINAVDASNILAYYAYMSASPAELLTVQEFMDRRRS